MRDSKETARRIIHNSVSLIGIKLMISVSLIVVTIALTRILTVSEFGLFSIIAAYYAVFRVISVFGIDSFLVREIACAEEKAGAFLGSAAALGLASAFISLLAMNGILQVMPNYTAELRLAGFLLSLSLFSVCWVRYVDSVYIAFGQTGILLLVVAGREIIKLGAVLTVLLLFKKLVPVMLVMTAASFLDLLLGFWILRSKVMRQPIRLDISLISRMFHESFSLALIAGVGTLFLAIDIIVLSRLGGEWEVGIYSVAYKFVTLPFLVADSLGTTLVPVLSRFWLQARDAFHRLSMTALKYFAIFIMGYILVMQFFAASIIQWVFGRAFAESARVLQVLIHASVSLVASYFLARILLAARQQKYDLMALLVGCAINGILNTVLTWQFGYMGTAWASVVSAAVLTGFHCFYLVRNVLAFKLWPVLFKPVMLGLAAVGLGFWFRGWNVYAGFVAAGSVYLFLLVISQVLRFDEIRFVQSVFKPAPESTPAL